MIENVLNSNKPLGTPGYEFGMAYQIQNYSANKVPNLKFKFGKAKAEPLTLTLPVAERKVIRNSDTQVTIVVPSFPTYALPPTQSEVIRLVGIPPTLIQGERPTIFFQTP